MVALTKYLAFTFATLASIAQFAGTDENAIALAAVAAAWAFIAKVW